MPPRYLPDRALPPYSYVTGLAPHPTSDPAGHSYGRHEPTAAPLDEATWRTNPAYLYGLDLFNHGYYWEAHEAWESLWHASGRSGPTADFLKGLIKLAAAGVKAREGRAAGVHLHAERAVQLFRGLQAGGPTSWFGQSLERLAAFAVQTAEQAQDLAGDGQGDAQRRLAFTLELQ